MAADLRILLIGNGGREHALAWKLSQSPRVQAILAVPGNGGTASCPKVTNLASVAADDFAGLVRLAQEQGVGLVVPGPEAPLVAGIEACFRRAGIPCFGPSPEAARLEGSKTYSKRFMSKYGIPTAAYANFDDYSQAVDYLDRLPDGAEVVIKATGLAAGKGVVMPGSRAEAKEALRRIMVEGEFGAAGDEVVIEQRLQGDELSLLTFCDGYTTRSLPLSQDHKRIGDGDEGPNTGGMGCYAPTNLATPDLLRTIERQIVEPTVAGMRKEKQPFRGLLFTGLMVTADGPKVLEYNVRFGDPETQTVLPLLSPDTDLAEIMLACTGGYLDNCRLQVDDKFSATVVLAAPGYPGPYPKGLPIRLGPVSSSTTLFHAGTELHQDQLQTSGGRVLAVNAVGPSLRAAVDTVYAALARDLVHFDGLFFRRDIAHRAFRSSTTTTTTAPMTYAQAGVDIEAGNAFVDKIRHAVASTRRPGADALIGGFGGELDLAACGYPGAPILVAAIDGVGTKLMVAQATQKHHAVGIDLVAMNVNDLIVQGARPLLFLDYYGCSRLHLASAAAFVEGVADGCRQAACALVGGETAEMPGMYRDDDYDVAGCAVGAVAAPDRLPRLQEMAEGHLLLGLASSGLHSNGFSLARRILDAAGLDYAAAAPWDPSQTVGDALLTPTRIYVAALLPVLGRIKALAHITGGGLIENPPRVLPPGLSAEINFGSWPLPPVFHWLREAGNVAPLEMCRTFNMGIGMIIVVDPAEAEAVTEMLQATEKVYRIGQLVPREQDQPPCLIRHLDF